MADQIAQCPLIHHIVLTVRQHISENLLCPLDPNCY